MTSGLGDRLRAANPVLTTRLVGPGDALLRRILATPRVVEHRQRLDPRRVVLVLVTALVVGGGIAAAFSRFVPQYFGSDDREPPPAAVLAQLRGLASEDVLTNVDARGLARVAAFDTESGRATIFVAPMRAGSGFCWVDATNEEIGGGGCEGPRSGGRLPYVSHSSSGWGDIRVLAGRLEAPAVRIDLRFEDGSVKPASVRAPWWVHVVGGDETEPGHRPVGLVALNASGGVAARERLDPYAYTAPDVVGRLLPESDGSIGQDAIRAVLEGLGGYAEPALPVQIDRTRLLRRIETREGTFDVYTAPSRAGVCFAMAHSRLPVEGTTGCPYEDESETSQSTTFEVDPSSIVQVAPSVFELDGTPPLGAARVEIRFEDGTTMPVDILVPSSFAAWVGPERLVAGRRPTMLVAFAADDREIATLRLDANRFRP
jgi:hypothetical protein